jgi:preprotein translocase SecE subunit
LATKKKTPASTKTGESTVTRIKATDDKPAKKVSEAVKPVETSKPGGNAFGRLTTPVSATTGYFKGAWYELRQVRWPNRRATWSLTAAVIGFTAAFVILILLLDALFKYLFQLLLG